MRTLRAFPAFTVAVLLTLALAGFNAAIVALMALRLDALLPGAFAEMGHFTQAHHRTHDLTFGFIFLPAVVGMLAQLRRPHQQVAGQVAAIVPVLALALTVLLTLLLYGNTNALQPPWVLVGAPAFLALVLHPAGRDFFRSFCFDRISRPMLALVMLAAVPLCVFAVRNIQLQGTAADDHALMGHYGFMAAFGLTVIGVGLLASLRPDGWRLTAWTAGLLPVLLGLTSPTYPDASSSLGAGWAVAATAWGLTFFAVAERERRATAPRSAPASQDGRAA